MHYESACKHTECCLDPSSLKIKYKEKSYRFGNDMREMSKLIFIFGWNNHTVIWSKTSNKQDVFGKHKTQNSPICLLKEYDFFIARCPCWPFPYKWMVTTVKFSMGEFTQISSPHRAVISLQKTWNIANKSYGLTAPVPHPLLLYAVDQFRLFPEQEEGE